MHRRTPGGPSIRVLRRVLKLQMCERARANERQTAFTAHPWETRASAQSTFFGTLKAEYFHLATLDGLEALEAGVHDYIHCYKHECIKLGLRGLSPVDYRLRSTA